MARFLIFTILFPALALVVFNAPDMMAGRFGLMDLTTLQMAYGIAVIPAWLVAAVDWALSAKPSYLQIVGTAAAAALASDSAALFLWGGANDLFPVLMAGLVGAIPAAACSWLSNINQTR